MVLALHLTLCTVFSCGALALHCNQHIPPQLSEESCIGPRLASSDMHLVVSAFDEDFAWLEELDVPTTVYMHDRGKSRSHHAKTKWGKKDSYSSMNSLRSANLNRSHPVEFVTIPNIGDEAAAYLRYILQVYDHAPETIVFIHAEQCSWHCGSDKLAMLRSACLLDAGYLHLSPNDDTGYLETNSCSHKETLHDRFRCMERTHNIAVGGSSLLSIKSVVKKARVQNPITFCKDELRPLWPTLFENDFGPLPDRLFVDGSAEFAISRSKLQAHPRSFYEALLVAVMQRKTSMEFFWRTIFA